MVRVALLLGALSGCATLGTRDRGTRPAASSMDALTAALAPRRRAIVIGVDRYQDPSFPPLKHAGHDAEALAGLLRDEQGGFDEVTVLIGATRAEVLSALQKAREELRREDELIVYFSGHGTRSSAEDGWRRFLLFSDSRARDLEGTALELSAIQDFFGGLAPARKALIVDACFNGEGRSASRRLTETPPADALRASGMGPGEAHLFATSPGRPAREADSLGHGVYTYFLLEAMSWSFAEADLDGDRVVTAYEAHDYARGRTMAYTDGAQIPEATFRVVGEGDLVLVGSPDERVRRDRALVYLYPLSEHSLRGAVLTIDGRDRGALPGTVPVSRGRHHFGLYEADGTPLAEGHTKLRGGRAYRADELARMIRGPTGGAQVQLTTLSIPALSEAVGASSGASVSLSRRAASGPRRGLTGSLSGGLGRGAGSSGPRSTGWAVGAVGMQQDFRWLRYQVMWGAGAVVIPPTDESISPSETPREAGWLLGSMGPELSAGVVLTEAWSVSLTGRAHGSLLDLDGSGQTQLVPWYTASIGVSLAR